MWPILVLEGYYNIKGFIKSVLKFVVVKVVLA